MPRRRWLRAFVEVVRLAFLPFRNLPNVLQWLALVIPVLLAAFGLATPKTAHLSRWQVLAAVLALAFVAVLIAAFRLKLAQLPAFPKMEVWVGGPSVGRAATHPQSGLPLGVGNQKDILLRDVRITSLEDYDLSVSIDVFAELHADSEPERFEVRAWPVRRTVAGWLSNPINVPARQSVGGNMKFFRSAVHDGEDRSFRVEVEDHHSGLRVRVPEFGKPFRPHEAAPPSPPGRRG